MSYPKELLRRLRMLFHRGQLDADLEEEMRMHRDLRRRQQIDAGLPPAAARRAANVKFGNTTRIQEKSRMTWGWEGLESFLQDAIYGIRAMLRSPALTSVALLSLALGIGANTAIFSLLDAVLLRSLPVKDPHRLLLMGTGDWNGISDDFALTDAYSYPFYRRLQQKDAVFSSTAAIFSMLNQAHGFVLDPNGQASIEAQPMNIQLVSGTYFETLGVEAQRGRLFTDADDNSEGDHPVAVISNAWWKRDFAGDPSVLTRRLKLGDTVFTIVGVAPPEFFGTKVGESPDIWIPLSMMKSVPPHWDGYKDNFSESLLIFGRLKPGATSQQATANVNLLFQQILRSFPDARLNQENLEKLAKAHVPLTSMATGLSDLRGQFSEPLQILMAVVALVLLIACANIANLLLARSTARARELAVRQALGAQRGRIIRQLLTESLILAFTGGALGIALASAANRLLLHMVSGGLDNIPLDVSLNIRLLLFTLAVTIATALIFGTIPAFRATRLQLTDTLKSGRSPQGVGARNPLARILVISQVALSLILMVAAGLFLRSLINLTNIDTGFNKENVLRLKIDFSSAGFKNDDPRQIALYNTITDRVSALPGVKAASFSSFTFREGSWNGGITVPGMPVNHDIDVKHNIIGAGYFATMQIPLIAGRGFDSTDSATSQRVAIVSQHMARTLFPNGEALGRSFHIGDPKSPYEQQVIGIARDVKFDDLTESPEDIDYLPFFQGNCCLNSFELRYAGNTGSISTAVQQTIHSIDRTLPISGITTLDDEVARSITNQRLVAQLSTFFGLLAVFLSSIGIYGLMSYVVSRRTNEIGIRMALGAARSNVRTLILREISLLVAIGIAIGIPAALIADRYITHMLYGLRGTDPLSLASATILLLIVALLAGFIPAQRASRVDPMVALRYE
jgi:predicted permease